MISRDDRAIPLNDFIGKDMFRDTAFTAYSVSTAKLHIEPSIVKENEWPFRLHGSLGGRFGDNEFVYYTEPDNGLMIAFISYLIMIMKESNISIIRQRINSFFIEEYLLALHDDLDGLIEPEPMFDGIAYSKRIVNAFRYGLSQTRYRLNARFAAVEIAKELKKVNIDYKSSRFLKTESMEESFHALKLLHNGLTNRAFGFANYCFWLPIHEIMILLCHENDMHIFFKNEHKEQIDMKIQEFGLYNNTETMRILRPSLRPCT